MSRETRICVEWTCDDCKEPYGPDDYRCHLSEGDTPDDWQVIDGLDVCDKCAEKRSCAAGGHNWGNWEPFGRRAYRDCLTCTAIEWELLNFIEETSACNLKVTGHRHAVQNDRGRNPGDVWTIPTQPFTEAHFAVFPVEIPRRAIAAGCKPGGVVLDPFSGSGTTGLAAAELGRRYVGIDLNRDYLELSLRTRLSQPSLTAEVGS